MNQHAMPSAQVQPIETIWTDLHGGEHLTWPMRLAQPLMEYMANSAHRRREARGGTLATNHILFDGLGILCRKIREGAASWQALDIIYNYAGEGTLIDKLWVGCMRNAQAVRNRKRIIVSQLRTHALSVAERTGRVRVLSLASGSAQAVFEAFEHFPYPVEICLVDFDRKAGPYAKALAEKYGLAASVQFKTGNVLKFDRSVIIGDFRPDIVEMAGLLDYLRDDEAVDVIRRIRALLKPDGIFITCHIHDNVERCFMTEIIDWGREDGKQRPMLYRTKEALVGLVRNGGFVDTLQIVTECNRIHSVAIAYA